MPQFFGFGERLLSEEQFRAASDSELRDLAAGSEPLVRVAPFSEPHDGTGGPGISLSAMPAPQPIGIGRPLSAEILYVYTGVLSRPGFSRPDMLVSSAVKQLPLYDAAPRAVQTLLRQVPQNHGFSSVPATDPGTPLIYHTPALTNRGLTVTLEMVFDRFPAETFAQIGNMLSAAAGIPVFAPAGAYLLAGSVIVKLMAKIAEAILDGRPAFSQTLSINVDRPMYEDTAPGYVLLTPSGTLSGALARHEYHIDATRGLLDSADRPYAGPDPYIAIGLDGSARPDYAKFAPTMATAAVLSRFLHMGENQPTATGLIVEALGAYNDVYYRSMAEATKKQLAEMQDQNSEEARKLGQLLAAYIKNIVNSDLKPAA